VTIGEAMLSFTGAGVYFFVKDIRSPPARARAISGAFGKIGIKMSAESRPEFGDADRVEIAVGVHP
jgi:hypothetical protein